MNAVKQVAVFALVVLCFIGGLSYVIGRDEKVTHEHQQQWIEFSKANHCRVIRDETFRDPKSLWQCDNNFQVKHSDNE